MTAAAPEGSRAAAIAGPARGPGLRSGGAGPAPNATLASRIDQTAWLARFLVRPDEPLAGFEPGRYVAVGLIHGDRVLQRPYSPARYVPGGLLELYVRRVPEPAGRLTPLLWSLAPGARLRVGTPRGRLTVDRADHRSRLLVATGTGLAPFVAMVCAETAASAPPTVLVHGVSHVTELGYREELETLAATRPGFRYVPVVSRSEEPGDRGWAGRRGRVPAVLPALLDELPFPVASIAAYLCGNPGAVEGARQVLQARGVPADAVHAESYWVERAADGAASAEEAHR